MRLRYRGRHPSAHVRLSPDGSLASSDPPAAIARLARAARWTSGEEALVHVLVLTAVVCMWLAWAIVYLAQVHPLVNPVLSDGQYLLYRFAPR